MPFGIGVRGWSNVGLHLFATQRHYFKPKVAEPANDYQNLKPEQANKLIKSLEEKMYVAARELEFEEAARIRDQIRKIQADTFGAWM